MRNLRQYIFESNEVTTTSNKQRKKELERWLQHKEYKEYVKTLDVMLEDPKAKTLLVDGFGGELGDTKLDFSIKQIVVSNLIPTQSDVDLDKSIKHEMTKIHAAKNVLENPIRVNKPLVTFRQNYVIDGHHTWLSALTFNPSGKVLCFNYDGDISPIQMLKVVQGTIAAVKAEDNDNNGDLPSQKTYGSNLFDKSFDEKAIREYVEKTLNENVMNVYVDNIEDCYDFDTTVNWITDRLLDIKANNHPLEIAQKREDMPQTDKGGTRYDDNDSALPNSHGSALNKMKDDEFVKGAVK